MNLNSWAIRQKILGSIFNGKKSSYNPENMANPEPSIQVDVTWSYYNL